VNEHAGIQSGKDFEMFGHDIALRSDDMRRVDEEKIVLVQA
jgi:hypothetical protein